MRHFIHSGDLGDVIYSLPAVKALGGGVMHLCDVEQLRTAHGMSRERFDTISPLLRVQPYIREIRPDFTPYPGDPATIPVVDLNEFRRRGVNLRDEWLPNNYLDVHGIGREAAIEPWLTVERLWAGSVVMARSARYHNPHFPWKRVLEKYGDGAVFVGTPAEHAAFNVEFDANIQYVRTGRLLELAQVIAGCDLFIGNQSCPLAIAEGLKKPVVCEVCDYCPNCISPRHDFIAGQHENVHLPDLEELCRINPKPSAATSMPTSAN